MKRTIAFIPAIALMAFLSCKKNQLGGKSTIKGNVAHHSRPIPNSTVFIKFNAKEFPGEDTNSYDSKVRTDAAGNFSFKCYKGDYYLYGHGLDYTLPQPPYDVVGGTPVHVRNKETLDVEVAVSED
jgi:hypothetical protein